MSEIVGKLRRNAEFLERKGWRKSAVIESEAAAEIEQQERRFAEHLEAWKANNAWHAARIAELERENRILRDYCRDPEEAKAAIHAAMGL